ncbi:MAG TPA: zinc ribbon domain-containing protein, partial [Burkholderiales bacterium]|nr:zinc ribbon domain-containing protein [Burkholderiales bacterium]
SCGFQKEYLQKVTDPVKTVCPECGKKTFSKMLTAAGFHLKGSGWYATDFRNPKPAAKTESKGETKSEGKSESKPDGKSAGKAESKTDSKTGSKSEAPSSGAGSSCS